MVQPTTVIHRPSTPKSPMRHHGLTEEAGAEDGDLAPETGAGGSTGGSSLSASRRALVGSVSIGSVMRYLAPREYGRNLIVKYELEARINSQYLGQRKLRIQQHDARLIEIRVGGIRSVGVLGIEEEAVEIVSVEIIASVDRH